MPTRLSRVYSIADMRRRARAVLPRAVFDLADGGAEDETTLRRNEAGFRDIYFLPKPLHGPATRDLSLTLFGQRLSMPVLVGPTGLAGLFWPEGEQCAARAALAAGTGYVLSHGSVCSLETLAETGVAPRFMQIHVYRDRSFTHEFIDRAAAAGYHGLVLTIDNQIIGKRERDLRNGFIIPPRLGPAEVAGMAVAGRWLWRMRRTLPSLTWGNYVRNGKPIAPVGGLQLAAMLDPGLSWVDVDDIRRRWKGPFLLKGVLHPDEARAAVEHGADGVIVSNHGGRQLDGAASGIEALPAVVEAVGGRIPVLVDGGVRRGGDVVKALSLGAAACLIARPQLWGLSVAGEAGVGRVLDIFRDEIDRVMGFLGAARLADLGPHLLYRPRS
jgi:isopentenyl diphosphate isomerase/L-lactate dehydrogenase-like FMN-dependent dehydrogenase